jgi:hypothetical protein
MAQAHVEHHYHDDHVHEHHDHADDSSSSTVATIVLLVAVVAILAFAFLAFRGTLPFRSAETDRTQIELNMPKSETPGNQTAPGSTKTPY